jgi:hypothetical protein
MTGIWESAPLRTAACGAILLLAGCSRASLLGGPGPEVAHHASPAESERLAEIKEVRKFDTKDECRQHLLAVSHAASPEQLIKISELEVRSYHSTGEGAATVHHEYSCVGKQLLERSWTGKAAAPPAPAHSSGHSPEVH